MNGLKLQDDFERFDDDELLMSRWRFFWSWRCRRWTKKVMKSLREGRDSMEMFEGSARNYHYWQISRWERSRAEWAVKNDYLMW